MKIKDKMKKNSFLLTLLMAIVMMAVNQTRMWAQEPVLEAQTLSLGDNTIPSTESGQVLGSFTAPETKYYAFTASVYGADMAIFKESDGSTTLVSARIPFNYELEKGVTYIINFYTHTSSYTLNIAEAKDVAQVTVGSTTKKYLTLSEAFRDAQKGTNSSPAKVKLLADTSGAHASYLYTLSSGVMTIDLNGYCIGASSVQGIIKVDGADVTIEDNSESKSGKVAGDEKVTYALEFTSGKLLINGGTFVAREKGLMCTVNPLREGILTLHGGTFKGLQNDCSVLVTAGNWGVIGMDKYIFEDISTGKRVIPTSGTPVVYGNVTVKMCPHTATRTNTPAVSLTEDADGNIEYWTCECGSIFDAATGGNELAEADVVLHSFDEEGFCKHCKGHQPAVYNGEKDVYLISNAGQLLWFMAKHADVNFDNKVAYNAELTCDITINKNVLNSDGSLNGTPAIRWIEPYAFFGKFDGKGHTISGIYCNGLYANGGSYSSGRGMVKYNSGIICNTTVKDSYFGAGVKADWVGTFAGTNEGVITDCSSFATVCGSIYVGGIAGYTGNYEISNCFFAGKLNSNNGSTCSPICNDYDYVVFTNPAVHNNYFLEDLLIGDMLNYRSTPVTLLDMKSGRVAYWLQAGRSTSVWGQTIDGDATDQYPVLGGAPIYCDKLLCDGKTLAGSTKLSNTPYENVDIPAHTFGDSKHYDATCTTGSYDSQVCSVCKYEKKTNEKAPNGHEDEDDDYRCDVCHDVIAEAPVLVTAANCEALGLDSKYIGYKAISNLGQLAGFAEELEAPMTLTKNKVEFPLKPLSVGNNSAYVCALSSKYFVFIPSTSTGYSFSLSNTKMCLYDGNPDFASTQLVAKGENSLACTLEQGKVYYLHVSNEGVSDMLGVNLVVSQVKRPIAGIVDAKQRRAASQTAGKDTTPTARRRKAAEVASPAADEPNYKYVLTDNIVVNANLLDENGVPRETDKDGKFRTDLLCWNSPDFYMYDEEAEEGIPAVFDGNGHTISGLYQNGSVEKRSYGYSGFFEDMSELSTVCKLGITDSYFSTSDKVYDIYVGSIAAYSDGVIDSCWSDATIFDRSTYTSYCGGLVGKTYGEVKVTGSHYDGVINSSNTCRYANYGGIAGEAIVYPGDESEISDCHFSGKFVNNMDECEYPSFGGIVGYICSYSESSTKVGLEIIDRCYADGSVINNNTDLDIGGIACYITCSSGKAAITNSYNAMEITNANKNASYKLGGIVYSAEDYYDNSGKVWINCCFTYGTYKTAKSYAPVIGEYSGLSVLTAYNIFLKGSNYSGASGGPAEELPDAEFAEGAVVEAVPISAKRRTIQLTDYTELPQEISAEQFASGYVADFFNYMNSFEEDDDDEMFCAPRRVNADLELVEVKLEPVSGEELIAQPIAVRAYKSVWYQNLGVDKYPVLHGDKYTEVYREDPRDYKYYNLERTMDKYELVDAVKYDLDAKYKVADFSYTRTFEGTNWTTWYVPFDLMLTEDICKKYAFSRINNVHQYDDDGDGEADRSIVESFRQKEGVIIKGNYPYLVKALTDADKDMTVELEDMTLYAAIEDSIDCQSIDNEYVFKGTYSGIAPEETEANQYSLFDDDPDGGEYGWEPFYSLTPQRHYLTISSRNSESDAKPSVRRIMLKIVGDEEATGVVSLYSKERQEAETYDLSGRRISSGSQQRGVRIENGKKVLVK